MKKVCIANWKMNGNLQDSSDFLLSINKKLSDYKITSSPDIILCPPVCYLYHFMDIIAEYSIPVLLGGQNCHWEDCGQFTGSISPKMLVDLGCKYVILGHLENKDQDHRVICKKVKAAIYSNLVVILCVSEDDLADNGLLQLIISSNFSSDKIIIAYEPSAAIGTGKLPDFNHLNLIIDQIRRFCNFRVIYGGSVNDLNAENLISSINLDGLLVGNASLDSDKFYKIVLSLQ